MWENGSHFRPHVSPQVTPRGSISVCSELHMGKPARTHTPDSAGPISASKFYRIGSPGFRKAEFRLNSGNLAPERAILRRGSRPGHFLGPGGSSLEPIGRFCLGNQYSVPGRRMHRTRNRKPRNTTQQGGTLTAIFFGLCSFPGALVVIFAYSATR